jgi:citrate synthase
MANKGGLEGIVVSDIKTSRVDGENGKLIYAGYSIEDLAANALFEEVAFLLWNTRLPNKEELVELDRLFAEGAALPYQVLDMMRLLPRKADPMAVLRTMVSALAHFDPDAENLVDKDIAQRKAIRLTAQMGAIVAAWDRIRSGAEPISPKIEYNFAQNFVYMLKGEEPDPTASDAINAYLVLLAEHGMNASTFGTRVTTATGSDMHSAVVSGIGTLKGPSHGGANAEAMRVFLEIGSPDNVENWFKSEVKEKGRRVMGIGHRVYKAPDPRAAVLKERAGALAQASGNTTWYDIAVGLADLAAADDYFIERQLYPNVDYYSAIVLYTIGLEVGDFTPLFAMSRVAGWTAHIIDQMGGRLIRPKANYVGPEDLSYTPVDGR